MKGFKRASNMVSLVSVEYVSGLGKGLEPRNTAGEKFGHVIIQGENAGGSV